MNQTPFFAFAEPHQQAPAYVELVDDEQGARLSVYERDGDAPAVVLDIPERDLARLYGALANRRRNRRAVAMRDGVTDETPPVPQAA